MDGTLSQEELDALLANLNEEQNSGQDDSQELFSSNEIDAIGEIANICAGSSATNLSAVLNQRVNITTPRVTVASLNEIVKDVEQPCLVVKVNYIEGIYGCSIQILHENDAKVITDLMLGDEITELHMSALCEAMNQMTGACATSFNTMLGRRVDISPPTASYVDIREKEAFEEAFDMKQDDKVVIVSFKFEVGTLIDSSFIQIYTVDFAQELYKLFEENNRKQQEKAEQEKAAAAAQQPVQPQPQPQPMPAQGMPMQQPVQPMPGMMPNPMEQGMMPGVMPPGGNVFGYEAMDIEEVNILPAHFSKFDPLIRPLDQKEKINIIDDVSLEITVELGKTQKSIQEILDFEEGSLVELNRFTGEMMDILVNGKVIAKGEVVVLEDKFAVQLKEININQDTTKKRRSKTHI